MTAPLAPHPLGVGALAFWPARRVSPDRAGAIGRRDFAARRAPRPPAEFLALQVSRLNEALFISYNVLSWLNLQAVDRAGARQISRFLRGRTSGTLRPIAARRAAARPARAGGADCAAGPEMAPQAIEKARFARGNGAP